MPDSGANTEPRPSDLEDRLDDITGREGQGPEARQSAGEGESFHEQQLGGIGRTGEGSSRDLQEPSSAQGGG